MFQHLEKIEVLLITFILFIIFFTFLYSFRMKFIDSLYTAVSFQTFIGTNLPENDNYLKVVSISQMILSYILVVIVLYVIL